MEPTVTKQPWYYQSWFIIPLMLFCFPVGIALMWIGKRYAPQTRYILTGIFGVIWIAAIVSSSRNQPNKTNSVPSQPAQVVQQKEPEISPEFKKLPLPEQKVEASSKTGGGYGYKTTQDNFGCLTKEYFENAQALVQIQDKETWKSLFSAGQCVLLDAGVPVGMIESSGMFGDNHLILYKGVRLWVNRKAVEFFDETKK